MPRFPIMRPWEGNDRAVVATCPNSIDWAIAEPHENQASRNHDQSLRTLARRGGLDPSEMVAVLEDRDWHAMELTDAIARLRELTNQG